MVFRSCPDTKLGNDKNLVPGSRKCSVSQCVEMAMEICYLYSFVGIYQIFSLLVCLSAAIV